MIKRAATCFFLAAFMATSNACMTWATRGVSAGNVYPKQEAKVISLVKKSGATVSFSASDPGRIRGNAIVGTAIAGAWESVEIPKPVPLVKKHDNGSVYEITTSEGRVYPVGKVLSEDDDKIVIFSGATKTAPVSIPLSEVASIKIRKFSFVKTGLAAAGVYVVGFTVMLLISLQADR